MATETFIEKNFAAGSMVLINKAVEICDSYQAQGYDLSLRQLYYQFVSRDLLANTEQNYKRLGSIISDARLAGYIDWDMIKDRGRETVSNSHWDSPAEILDACARQFRIDTWADQENHVEVMVEKQALEGVLEPVCRELDISFTANKGYSSSSALYEAGKRLADHRLSGKELFVIYLGDHDPSGIDMTRDVEERLRLFSESPVTVNRVALNMEQVRRFNPPENPAKLTDSRSAEYVRRFGDSSWELDALDPATLANLVRTAVLALRDETIHREAAAKQQAWRDEIRELARGYKEGDQS